MNHNLFSFTELLIIAGSLLVMSVLASKTSSRLGVPALVLFLALGMLAGSEGIGGIFFEDYHLANVIGTVALIYILFAGGLDTHWSSVRAVVLPSFALSTVGVLITASLIALAAHSITNLPWELSVLLGAVVSSTDAAAVFGALRSKGIRLKGNLASLLELESGSNDPMAVFLTVGITGMILSPGSEVTELIPKFFIEMIVGGLGGALIGYGAYKIIDRIDLDSEGLYPVLSTGVALLAYAVPHELGGNGFLAAYVAGITLGSNKFLPRLSLIQFHDGLGWLMQITMFLSLGLLVFPTRLAPIMVPSILAALLLIFVARPVAVFVSLIPFNYSWCEKVLISWVGLRGAVPIILATIPVTQGIAGAEVIFDEVFFIVLSSVVIQGISIGWLANKLDLVLPNYSGIKERKLASHTLEFRLSPQASAVGKTLAELSLPGGVLVVLIRRGTEIFTPRAATVLEAKDLLIISNEKVDHQELSKYFE
jgi:cell volume regulation protein A